MKTTAPAVITISIAAIAHILTIAILRARNPTSPAIIVRQPAPLMTVWRRSTIISTRLPAISTLATRPAAALLQTTSSLEEVVVSLLLLFVGRDERGGMLFAFAELGGVEAGWDL